MRSRLLLTALAMLALAGCRDVTRPTSVLVAPTGARYQLSQSGTLDGEIQALFQVLLPNGLANAAQKRWDGVKDKVASGDLSNAKSKLLELSQWLTDKESSMNPPPDGSSIPAATARAILYMSLYVYSGPTTPIPASFGRNADATVAIVSPTSPAFIQTPTKHAAAIFDAGSVAQSSIVVVSQNTQQFSHHCEGPLVTKYCQYPLFYHYQVFPTQRFQKLVHVAVCHVPTGGQFGPLPGVDHDRFVVIHDKPTDPGSYTPGGYPVPGENVEVLPKYSGRRTPAAISCQGTTYPQVAYFNVPRKPQGLLENVRALAASTLNGAMQTVGNVISPKNLYAIDNGEEHMTSAFSTMEDADTLGHPDLNVSGTSASNSTVTQGKAVSLTYTVGNAGTAPSPTVTTKILLQRTEQPPIELTPAPALTWGGPLYPLDTHSETAVVTIPATVAPGNYTITAFVTSVGGLGDTIPVNNSQPVALTVVAARPTLGVLIYGPTMSAPTTERPDNEQTLAQAAGLTVTVADAATWTSYTAADFARYNAIVFGDPTCGYDQADYNAANDNKTVWSPVVTGPSIIIGTDPQYHQSQPGVQARQLMTNGLKYAASGNTTGLYVSLSCYYHTATDGTPVTYLDGIGNFTVGYQGSNANTAYIVQPTHPAMAGLTDAGLSNWNESIHAFFSGGLSSFPSTFHALVTGIRDNNAVYEYPYIIAR